MPVEGVELRMQPETDFGSDRASCDFSRSVITRWIQESLPVPAKLEEVEFNTCQPFRMASTSEFRHGRCVHSRLAQGAFHAKVGP